MNEETTKESNSLFFAILHCSKSIISAFQAEMKIKIPVSLFITIGIGVPSVVFFNNSRANLFLTINSVNNVYAVLRNSKNKLQNFKIQNSAFQGTIIWRNLRKTLNLKEKIKLIHFVKKNPSLGSQKLGQIFGARKTSVASISKDEENIPKEFEIFED